MEPPLTDELYLLFRDFLRSRSGLFYPEHKRDDLTHGLHLAMKATGHRSIAELYDDATKNTSVWETVLAHLTIGETSFWRNRPQFEALRDSVLPELLERRSQLRTIRIWSAGCATGEEPYSVAILLKELIPDIQDWHVSILATDINPDFLARAREGVYGNWSFRDTPGILKERYFVQEGRYWRLKPDIRAMVTFARINLIEQVYPLVTNGTTALDIIFCRNVTIYFDESTTRDIVERFYKALSPGGWLIVGHAEPQASIYHQFEVYNFPNTVVYRKSLDAPFFVWENPALYMEGTSSSHAPASWIPTLWPSQPERGQPLQPSPSQHGTPIPSTPSTGWPNGSADVPSWALSQDPPNTPSQEPDSPSMSSPAPLKALPFTSSSSQSSPPSVTEPSAEHLWPKISGHLALGDKVGAEKLLHELLTIEPEHANARTALGRLCADRGEWACAQYHCESAIKHDPLNLDAHYILAQVYEHEGQFESALNEYRRVVFLDRRYVLGMLGMANIWRQMGNVDDARRSYRNILKQLATMSPSAVVPGTDGATASEISTFVTRQLQSL
jgi:chemotaxis protein methyltransferase CheR